MSEAAVAALRSGRAVILPTDTVYGLCALPEHEDVLYELKGRDRVPGHRRNSVRAVRNASGCST